MAAPSGPASGEQYKVYVSNLPFECDEDGLLDCFKRQCGRDAVLSSQIIRTREGQPKGFGCVRVRVRVEGGLHGTCHARRMARRAPGSRMRALSMLSRQRPGAQHQHAAPPPTATRTLLRARSFVCLTSYQAMQMAIEKASGLALPDAAGRLKRLNAAQLCSPPRAGPLARANALLGLVALPTVR